MSSSLIWERDDAGRFAVVDDNHVVRIERWRDEAGPSTFSVMLGLSHIGSAGTVEAAKAIAENHPRVRALLAARVAA